MKPMRIDAAADEAAAFLRAMGHPARLRIVCALVNHERAASPLAAVAGIRAPALSQHAAILEADGLISRRRDGRTILYRLAAPRAKKLATLLQQIFCTPRRRAPGRRAATRRRFP